MAACFGDDPDAQPRDPDRPDGQLIRGRRAGADAQAGRHDDHAATTWSTRSAWTPPATRWPATRPTRRSTLDLDCGSRGRPTTTRSSTCSTRTPGSPSMLRNAAELGLEPRRAATSTRRCSPTSGRASCSGRSPSSRAVVATRGRAARAAPGRPLPRGTGRRPTTGSTTPAGCCRMGDEEPTDLHRARLVAGRGDPDRPRQRARPARRLRPRADVGDPCARTRPGALHADGALRGPSLAARRPSDVERAGRRRCGRAPARAATTARCEVGGVDVPRRWPPSTAPRRTSSTRPTSGPGAAAFRDAFAGVRRLLRRQGVPLHDGRRAGSPRRGSASTSAPAASWPSRCAAGFDPARIGFHGNNKSVAELRAGGRRRASAGSSSTRSTRSTGWPRVAGELGVRRSG